MSLGILGVFCKDARFLFILSLRLVRERSSGTVYYSQWTCWFFLVPVSYFLFFIFFLYTGLWKLSIFWAKGFRKEYVLVESIGRHSVVLARVGGSPISIEADSDSATAVERINLIDAGCRR